jgi:hypothetical protein
MPKDKMYDIEFLLQCWTVAYEKAIVAREFNRAKKTIDKACSEAVEELTKLLLNAGSITEKDTVGNRFDTMEDSIRHHIGNLDKGGMFNTDQKLDIKEQTKYGEKVVEITVDNCTYQDGCKWALYEPVFTENGGYRCQRLGCFVGAVKKYMTEETLPEDQRKKLDYLMTSVMEDDEKNGIRCRCKGFVFPSEPGLRGYFLRDYPTQFPTNK